MFWTIVGALTLFFIGIPLIIEIISHLFERNLKIIIQEPKNNVRLFPLKSVQSLIIKITVVLVILIIATGLLGIIFIIIRSLFH